MEVNIEELVAGLFFLAYVVYGPLVRWILETKLDQQRWPMGHCFRRPHLLRMHAHSFPSSWYCFDA